MKFFTSDHHFWHKAIIGMQPNRRHFNSIEEMNNFLITQWNNKVNPQDEVFHLGDLCFANYEFAAEIVRQLNGRIRFIKGNHDSKGVLNRLQKDKLIEWWKSDYQVKFKDEELGTVKIHLYHFPVESWNKAHNPNSIHLHGHVHYNHSHESKMVERRMDVGVDNPICNFAPISWNEIKVKLFLI